MRNLLTLAALAATAWPGPLRADDIGARCGLGSVGFVSTRAGTVCLQANPEGGARLAPTVRDTPPTANAPSTASSGGGTSSFGPRIGTTLDGP